MYRGDIVGRMKSAIAGAISSNPLLAGWLTGGVHVVREISRQATPVAFDADGEILPCALVKVETETPAGPDDYAGRQFITISLYERSGFGVIDLAVAQLYSLLHRAKVSGAWEVRHADDVRDQVDEALGCSMALCRYQVWRYRG